MRKKGQDEDEEIEERIMRKRIRKSSCFWRAEGNRRLIFAVMLKVMNAAVAPDAVM